MTQPPAGLPRDSSIVDPHEAFPSQVKNKPWEEVKSALESLQTKASQWGHAAVDLIPARKLRRLQREMGDLAFVKDIKNAAHDLKWDAKFALIDIEYSKAGRTAKSAYESAIEGLDSAWKKVYGKAKEGLESGYDKAKEGFESAYDSIIEKVASKPAPEAKPVSTTPPTTHPDAVSPPSSVTPPLIRRAPTNGLPPIPKKEAELARPAGQTSPTSSYPKERSQTSPTSAMPIRALGDFIKLTSQPAPDFSTQIPQQATGKLVPSTDKTLRADTQGPFLTAPGRLQQLPTTPVPADDISRTAKGHLEGLPTVTQKAAAAKPLSEEKLLRAANQTVGDLKKLIVEIDTAQLDRNAQLESLEKQVRDARELSNNSPAFEKKQRELEKFKKTDLVELDRKIQKRNKEVNILLIGRVVTQMLDPSQEVSEKERGNFAQLRLQLQTLSKLPHLSSQLVKDKKELEAARIALDQAQSAYKELVGKLNRFNQEIEFAPQRLAKARQALAVLPKDPSGSISTKEKELDETIKKAEIVLNEPAEDTAAKREEMDKQIAAAQENMMIQRQKLEQMVQDRRSNYSPPVALSDRELVSHLEKMQHEIDVFYPEEAKRLSLPQPPERANKDYLRLHEAIVYEMKFLQSVTDLRTIYEKALSQKSLISKVNDKEILGQFIDVCKRTEALLNSSLEELKTKEHSILAGQGSPEEKNQKILDLRSEYFFKKSETGVIALNGKFFALMKLQQEANTLKMRYDKSDNLHKDVSKTLGFNGNLHNPVIFFQQLTKYPSLLEAWANDTLNKENRNTIVVAKGMINEFIQSPMTR